MKALFLHILTTIVTINTGVKAFTSSSLKFQTEIRKIQFGTTKGTNNVGNTYDEGNKVNNNFVVSTVTSSRTSLSSIDPSSVASFSSTIIISEESWRQYVPLAVSLFVIIDILLGSPFVNMIVAPMKRQAEEKERNGDGQVDSSDNQTQGKEDSGNGGGGILSFLLGKEGDSLSNQKTKGPVKKKSRARIEGLDAIAKEEVARAKAALEAARENDKLSYTEKMRKIQPNYDPIQEQKIAQEKNIQRIQEVNEKFIQRSRLIQKNLKEEDSSSSSSSEGQS